MESECNHTGIHYGGGGIARAIAMVKGLLQYVVVSIGGIMLGLRGQLGKRAYPCKLL